MDLAERVEKEAELTRILSEFSAGKGAVVLLEGPGGSGKTELLHTVAGRARRSGGLVLHAGCSRAESALPFGVLGQLFSSMPAADGPVARPQALRRRLHAEATAEDPAHDTAAIGPRLARLFDEVTATLLELAQTAPVFTGIDTIRHADPQSLACLLYLMRRTASARVMVALTDDTTAHRGLFRTELLDQPHTHRLALEPLTEDQVAALPAPHLEQAEAERLVGEFHTVSGGNLRLLRALIDDHLACGGVGKDGYGSAVLRRLGRLEEPVVAVSRALAVLGSAEAPDRLARLARRRRRHGRRRAADPRLRVTGSGLSHGIAREAVLDDLAPEERTGLRLAAAALLHEQGCPPRDIAPPLIEADRSGGAWSVHLADPARARRRGGRTGGRVRSRLTTRFHCSRKEGTLTSAS